MKNLYRKLIQYSVKQRIKKLERRGENINREKIVKEMEAVNPIALFMYFVFIIFFIDNYFSLNIFIYLFPIFLIIFLVFRILKRFKFHKKFSNFLSGLKSGLTVIMRMEQKFAFIVHSIFIWLMYVLMFYVTSFAFSDLHGANFFHLLISFTLAALSIMFSNGGIGIYPLAVEESLFWYGIESVNGLAFGWVMWLSQTIMVIIFGGLSLFILPFINSSNSRN